MSEPSSAHPASSTAASARSATAGAPRAVPAGVVRAGLAVVADAGRLLAAHWPALVLLAVVGAVSRELILDAAVRASRASSVLSQLVVALAPFVQLLTVVGMLLVMRRRAGTQRPVVSLVVGTAAVMLPFLVIYQHYGYLAEDVIAFGAGTADDVVNQGLDPSSPGADVVTRLPAGTSVTVLATVAAALLLRRLLDRLAVRQGGEVRTSLLRLLAGYCEVVWLVLGAYVVTVLVDGASGWWSSRAVGVALSDWWQGVVVDWPFAGALARTLLSGVALLLAAASTGFLVPLAWLALAGIIYGVQAARMLSARDLHRARVAGSVVGRLGDARTDRALRLVTDPERRYGTVVGGTALVLRAGWSPVLVFCLAFLVADNADAVVTGLTRWAVGPRTPLAWAALLPVVELVGAVLVRVLTLALVASAVDSLLRTLGLPGGLRLPSRPQGHGEEVRAEGELVGAGAEEVEASRR